MLAGEVPCPQYFRRRPEHTLCYRIIQEHLASFFANWQEEGRPYLPMCGKSLKHFCPDGAYTRVNGKPQFHKLTAITAKQVGELISSISQSIMRFLKKQGYLDQDGEVVLNPMDDDSCQDSEALSLATACSIVGKIAFGP